MIGAFLFYTGLMVALGGAAFLIKPLGFLGIHTRPQGGVILGAGLLLSIVALLFPATKKTVLAPRTKLDAFSPVFQFNERHSARIHAPCDRVYAAVKGVKADEILFFRALTSIRRFGRSGPENILNPPEQPPLLDVATRTSFLLLSEEPGREIVVGTVVLAPQDTRFRSHFTPEQFRDLDAPGFGPKRGHRYTELVRAWTVCRCPESRSTAVRPATPWFATQPQPAPANGQKSRPGDCAPRRACRGQ